MSSAEQKELLDWRQQDPENEKLFFEMTDPESLRLEMQSFYHDRDGDFEKLKVLQPDLGGTSLTGSVDEAVRIFREASEVEKADPLYQKENFYSKSGLTPVEYWDSTISNLEDDDREGIRNEKNDRDQIKAESTFPKKGKKRGIIRKLLVAAAVMFLVWILDGILAGSKSNTEVVMISPEGERFKVSDFNRGKLAGLANISFGETETGETIYIVSDQPKSKKDNFYTLMSAPKGEFLLRFPDGSRVWICRNGNQIPCKL